jgi:hypothetical protein
MVRTGLRPAQALRAGTLGSAAFLRGLGPHRLNRTRLHVADRVRVARLEAREWKTHSRAMPCVERFRAEAVPA